VGTVDDARHARGRRSPRCQAGLFGKVLRSSLTLTWLTQRRCFVALTNARASWPKAHGPSTYRVTLTIFLARCRRSVGPSWVEAAFGWIDDAPTMNTLQTTRRVATRSASNATNVRAVRDLVIPATCQVVGPATRDTDGHMTWSVWCSADATTTLQQELMTSGWSSCGVAAGTAYYRKGDGVTTLSIQRGDTAQPSQLPRTERQ
jgi:hypothetical protein